MLNGKISVVSHERLFADVAEIGQIGALYIRIVWADYVRWIRSPRKRGTYKL